jgi:hypothetical protein
VIASYVETSGKHLVVDSAGAAPAPLNQRCGYAGFKSFAVKVILPFENDQLASEVQSTPDLGGEDDGPR